MSNTKERIIEAVNQMHEIQAQQVWDFIVRSNQLVEIEVELPQYLDRLASKQNLDLSAIMYEAILEEFEENLDADI